MKPKWLEEECIDVGTDTYHREQGDAFWGWIEEKHLTLLDEPVLRLLWEAFGAGIGSTSVT